MDKDLKGTRKKGLEEENIKKEDPSHPEEIKLSDTKEKDDQKLKDLQKEISSLKDLYLRNQAEFDNFRKRVNKEKEEIAIYANKQLIEEFITLIDNFERALETSQENKDFDQLIKGISLIRDSFLSNMKNKFQLESFGEKGESFDPQKHEAISVETSEEDREPVVKEVFQRGYMLKDRPIRTAKVKVSQP